MISKPGVRVHVTAERRRRTGVLELKEDLLFLADQSNQSLCVSEKLLPVVFPGRIDKLMPKRLFYARKMCLQVS